MIHPCRHLQRAYLCQGQSLGSSFISDIADFKEMVVGSVQAVWSGDDATTGELELWSSDDGVHFDRIDGSLRDLNHPNKTRLWNLGVIGFRYLQLRYDAKTVTAGTLEAFALGKISK